MSIAKSENSNVISDRAGITLMGQMGRAESPQEYVNRIMQAAGLSHRQVAERAAARGHKLSAGYTHNIASGEVDNPSIRLIQALAAGLGRPEEEVIAVFRGKPVTEEAAYKESFFGVIWNEFNCLSLQDQRELRPAIDMLHHEILRRLR